MKFESRRKESALQRDERGSGDAIENQGLLRVELMTKIVFEQRAKVEMQSGNGNSTFKYTEPDTDLA